MVVAIANASTASRRRIWRSMWARPYRESDLVFSTGRASQCGGCPAWPTPWLLASVGGRDRGEYLVETRRGVSQHWGEHMAVSLGYQNRAMPKQVLDYANRNAR